MRRIHLLVVSISNALMLLLGFNGARSREEIEIYLMRKVEKPSVTAVMYLVDQNGNRAGVEVMYSRSAARQDVFFRDRVVELVQWYGATGVYIGIPRFTGHPAIPSTDDYSNYVELLSVLFQINVKLIDVLIVNNGLIQSVSTWHRLFGPVGISSFVSDTEYQNLQFQCYLCGEYGEFKPESVCGRCCTDAVMDSTIVDAPFV